MPTVLLVENDEQLRTMLKLTLIYSGYEVLEADTGKAVGTVYEQQRPDLVIIDLLMPLNQGLEVVMDLRKADRKARILAISGPGHAKTESYSLLADQLGAYHTLPKPFTTTEFLDAVHSALEAEA